MVRFLSYMCCLFFMFYGIKTEANEWIPYVPTVIMPVQQVQYVPVVSMIPVVRQYVPVVTYQNVVVEHKQLCIFKRYEVLVVPKVVYVPVKY